MVGQCKALIDQIEKVDDYGETVGDQNLVRELQVMFDKYSHAYLNKRVGTQVQRDIIGEMIEEDLPRNFEQKWMDLLDEVD